MLQGVLCDSIVLIRDASADPSAIEARLQKKGNYQPSSLGANRRRIDPCEHAEEDWLHFQKVRSVERDKSNLRRQTTLSSAVLFTEFPVQPRRPPPLLLLPSDLSSPPPFARSPRQRKKKAVLPQQNPLRLRLASDARIAAVCVRKSEVSPFPFVPPSGAFLTRAPRAAPRALSRPRTVHSSVRRIVLLHF